MEFLVLGGVEIRTKDGVRSPGGPLPKALLGLLLVGRGQPVGVSTLIEELYSARLPANPEKRLEDLVLNLRRALEDRDRQLLKRSAGGYELLVDALSVDARRFEAAIERARGERHTRPQQARATLTEALGLWRGVPFAGAAETQALNLEARRLDEVRLRALEDRIELDLEAGEHANVVGELETLTVAHEYRERLWAQRAVALSRCGRHVEAVRVLNLARERFADGGFTLPPELQHLELRLLRHAPELRASRPEPAPLCPYKGLATYQPWDERLFFGRAELIEELLARVTTSPVVIVFGRSGNGKSSAVRAGLVPALRKHGRQVVVITPGNRPLEQLRDAEGRAAADGTDGGGTVVVLDQAEELYTRLSRDERTSLLDHLVAITDPGAEQQRGANVVVVVRSDYLGEMLEHRDLVERARGHHVLVHPLSAESIREVVLGPARSVGFEVEERIVDAVIAQAANEPGSLPLISHALVETWRYRNVDQHLLTFEGYQRCGGVAGAIAATADERTRLLPSQTTRRILTTLVRPGTDGPDTRRAADVGELIGASDNPTEATAVIESLVEARLLTLEGTKVELAHEALIVEWPTLQAWVNEDRESLLRARRLAEDAQRWQAAERDPALLYRGRLLSNAVDPASVVGPLEHAFLAASQALADRSLRTRARVRLALVLGALAAVFVVGLAARSLADAYGESQAQKQTRADLIEADGLPAFERSLVTYKRYRTCVQWGACERPNQIPGTAAFDRADDERPVVAASATDAQAFCTWIGRTLPTWDQYVAAGELLRAGVTALGSTDEPPSVTTAGTERWEWTASPDQCDAQSTACDWNAGQASVESLKVWSGRDTPQVGLPDAGYLNIYFRCVAKGS